ncbi:hypothetical protein R6Q59_018801 [Mikania micrantha]
MMDTKRDMMSRLCELSEKEFSDFCVRYHIEPEFRPTWPDSASNICEPPLGFVGVYTRFFDFSNIRLPMPVFLFNVLEHYSVHISQMAPYGLNVIINFDMACRSLGSYPTVSLFRKFFRLAKNGDWFTVERFRDMYPQCIHGISQSPKYWKNSFFWISLAYFPFVMSWKDPSKLLMVKSLRDPMNDRKLFSELYEKRTYIRSYPEPLLILVGLSKNCDSSTFIPVYLWQGVEMDVISILSLESHFDGEFSSRPRKKGDKVPLEGVLHEFGSKYDSVVGKGSGENVKQEKPELVPKAEKATASGKRKGKKSTGSPSGFSRYAIALQRVNHLPDFFTRVYPKTLESYKGDNFDMD